MATNEGTALMQSICDQNLAVYEASPTRLREDVGQEAEIAHDYRGRLVYELLQNADDAMASAPTHQDSIWIQLTETDLWVGNSGRPLDEDDVRGLCGIGASSKGAAVGRRRASIGHKGMGFKSVLEITDTPEVISETFAFRLGRDLARDPIERLMASLGEPKPKRVPVMRFPTVVSNRPPEWEQENSKGLRTLFRFPLRPDIDEVRGSKLADRLLGLPATAIVFLKNLEQIDIDVDVGGRHERVAWRVRREVRTEQGWAESPGLTEPGIYRVTVTSEGTNGRQFLIAHDNELEIGEHRGALDPYAWDGIELSEIAVAAELVEGRPVQLQPQARVLHVFLPTGEPCPYPLLINGAFSADLSRQEIRTSDEANDYNRWLLGRAAHLFGETLVPALREFEATDAEILGLLDRGIADPGEPAATSTAAELIECMRGALAASPIVSLATGEVVAATNCAVPPIASEDPSAGQLFRRLLADAATVDGRSFPAESVCGGRPALVLADHGARVLTPSEAPRLLAANDLSHVRLEEHESGGIYVDPVLRVIERLWNGLPAGGRDDLEAAVRASALLPVDRDETGRIDRVAVGDLDCYYPPRALSGGVPLNGLCFIARDVCWGNLLPKDRQEILKGQMSAWQALFGVRDFKFPDVMRSSVLPALTLPDEGGRAPEWESLQNLETLAAVCQLSGRTPSPGAPLPYERLGTNRALFNLSRMPVPCRTDVEGDFRWEPAYRVYFGHEWVGAASIEHVLEAIAEAGGEPPEVPLLASPEALVPLLDRYQHLREAVDAEDDAEDDEVDIDEDEDEALDVTGRDRWLSFLSWLGVNRGLRAVPFNDVEDRNAGWLTTKGLERPRGRAIRDLPADLWDPYVAQVRSDLAEKGPASGTQCFYSLHDLEHIVDLLAAAAEDAECGVSAALFAHLTENWSQLQRFTRLEVAVVPEGLVPSMRAKPPRAKAEERQRLGADLWLWRLRQRDFLPTSHGPKAPADTWVRTRELERRFTSSRGNVDCSMLLPVLQADDGTARNSASMLSALGVRDEMTASSLRPKDAMTILKRLELLSVDTPDRAMVREVIRPTYRSLIELLPGRAGDDRFGPGVLADAPLLVENGHGDFRFQRAAGVLWAERNGTRERLGNPESLWTFVLEGSTGARAPLTELFDVRTLEDHLDWTPTVGDDALDRDELESFRKGVDDLAPHLLARLAADRATEPLQRRDAAVIQRLTRLLRPVDALSVACTLDGSTMATGAREDAFVDLSGGEGTLAFVKWGEQGWPPSASEAEALATAFAEVLGATYFEAFLALINARDESTRLRMLSLAGASTDVDAMRRVLDGAIDPDGDGPRRGPIEPPAKEPGIKVDEEPAQPPSPYEPGDAERMTPIYAPEELTIKGVPVVVTGPGPGPTPPPPKPRGHSRSRGSGSGYGGRTDLGELDRVGMYVAMAFEEARLRRHGNVAAEILDPSVDHVQEAAFVFDVSSKGLIDRARELSPRFAAAMSHLLGLGVDIKHPGCDILTLGNDPAAPVDRLIELKSSGLNARKQSMTWNEWKTAQNPDLRSHFYLYLVGNLRSDLPDATPFLRAIRDPYGTMSSREQTEQSRTRSVELNVLEFEKSDFLELEVKQGTCNESSS